MPWLQSLFGYFFIVGGGVGVWWGGWIWKCSCNLCFLIGEVFCMMAGLACNNVVITLRGNHESRQLCVCILTPILFVAYLLVQYLLFAIYHALNAYPGCLLLVCVLRPIRFISSAQN